MLFEEVLVVLLMFFLYCIAGWVWECIYMSVLEKTLLNRGFLNGPYIPIYGFAGLVVYFSLRGLNSPFLHMNTVKIYLIGLVCATAIEYVTSILLEKIFKAQWWDYTIYKFNFQGRICLIASLFWGVIAVLFVQVINPQLLIFFHKFPHDAKLTIVSAMATLMLVDTGVTIYSLINLHQKITALVEVENAKWEKFVTKIEGIPSDYQAVLNSYREKAFKTSDPVALRWMKAFPRMHFVSASRQKVYEMVRNQIDNKRRK